MDRAVQLWDPDCHWYCVISIWRMVERVLPDRSTVILLPDVDTLPLSRPSAPVVSW